MRKWPVHVDCLQLPFILGVNSPHKPDTLSTAVSHHGPGVFRLRHELVVSIVQSGFLPCRGSLTDERWPFVCKIVLMRTSRTRDDVLVSIRSSKLIEMTLDMQSSLSLLRLGIRFLSHRYYFCLSYVPT